MNPHQHSFDLPAATHAYLARAASSLREAMTSTDVPARYAHAHVAALRATAALLAARATPTVSTRRARQQKNAWVLLAEVAPELGEWAAFFSAGAAKRAAAEAGSQRAVTEREADDLIRDADRFLGVVEESLGMTRHVPVDSSTYVTPTCLTGGSRRSVRSSGTVEERRRGGEGVTSSDEKAVGGRTGRRDHVA